MCDVLKTTNRPKVHRIILATFRVSMVVYYSIYIMIMYIHCLQNLIEKAEPDIAEKYSAEMIHFKAIPVST